jgi:catechol 2,3-dioxygenase-like lactoylglutathione lyase family enzyme
MGVIVATATYHAEMGLGAAFFHVGIVVPQLEAARDRFSELLGLTWHDTVESSMPMRVEATGEDQTVPLRAIFTREEPHLELIEAIPGTLWTLAPDGGPCLHHLAFWTPDLVAESDRLGAVQCPLEAYMPRPEDGRPKAFAYHLESSLRLELIDQALKPGMFPS